MPVYHFTLHAYRSWRPDHPRGYTVKGEGYQPSDSGAAYEYDHYARQDPVVFDETIQRELLVLTHEICVRELWRLEAAGSDPTHQHVVISWRKFQRWEDADQRLKNLLSLKLNRRHNTPGKRWFVRRHSAPRRVEHESHLKHLLTVYLPGHPGLFWERGMDLPSIDPAL